MAGPAPRDVYDPVQTVAPDTRQETNDSLSVRSNSADFGGQIGQAVSKAGSDADQLGNSAMQVAIQQQGMYNETVATDAETAAASAYGAITGKYRSTDGLEAVHALPQTIADIQQVRQNIRGTLPNAAAQRSFDLLAARHEANALEGANLYAATQLKQADTNSATAATSLAIDQAADPTIALDDNKFQDNLGTIKFQAARVLTNQGYGPDSGTGMAIDPKTGDISFADTPEGSMAQAVAKQYMNEAVGKAWETRINTVAHDPNSGNINTAVAMLEKNKDSIPAATYSKLSTELAPAYRSGQTKSISDGVISQFQNDYTNSISAPATSSTPTTPQSVASLTDRFINQESSNGATSTNLGQVQPDTWKQYAKPGEDINNPTDNRAVTQRILADYNTKYNGDLGRIATAYFSGPGNVSPSGSPTPYIHNSADSSGKTTSSYVADITGGGSSQGSYQSQADFVRNNYTRYVQQARDQATASHPDDPVFQDQAVARTEQQLRTVIATEDLQGKADLDSVQNTLFGTGNGPNKGHLITDQSQLDSNPDPDVKASWQRLQVQNPLAAQAIRNKIITANQQGQSATYGSEFSTHLDDVLSGRVTNPADLMNYLSSGKNAPLTNTGFQVLSRYIGENNTPEGQSWATAQHQFFTQSKNKIAPETAAYPYDPEGEKKYNDFLLSSIPRIEAARAAGKTPAEVFNDPSSKDYIGNNISTFTRSNSQIFSDKQKHAQTSTNQTPAFSFDALKGVNDKDQGNTQLHDLVGKKTITTRQAKDYSISRGWTSNAPPVPNR